MATLSMNWAEKMPRIWEFLKMSWRILIARNIPVMLQKFKRLSKDRASLGYEREAKNVRTLISREKYTGCNWVSLNDAHFDFGVKVN